MKGRKVLAIVLAMVMVLGSFSMAFGQTAAEAFPDVEGHWAKTALVNAVNNGLLKGDNGYILPDNNLTRAQMAAVVNRAFGATQMASLAGYTDVPSDAWYYDDMAKAVQMKTFMGSDGKLTPDANITREQAFVVLARGIARTGAPTSALDKFSDAALVSDWAKDGVASLVAAGYVNGSNGMLHPQMNITRAEFAQIMDNILKNYIKSPDTYTTDFIGNLVINVPEVTLKGTTVNGGLLIGDGVGTGSVTLDGVTVTGRMVVRGGGDHSIKILGDSNIGSITIAHVGDTVRIFAANGAEIPVIYVMGDADVIIEGNVGTIHVLSDNITVTATNATIGTAIVSGEESKIIVDDKSSIGSITVTGEGTVISGEGEVKTVLANANDVIVNTVDTKVTAGPGTTGVMAGSTAVKAGTTETVVQEIVFGGGGGVIVPTTPKTPVMSIASVKVNGTEITPSGTPDLYIIGADADKNNAAVDVTITNTDNVTYTAEMSIKNGANEVAYASTSGITKANVDSLSDYGSVTLGNLATILDALGGSATGWYTVDGVKQTETVDGTGLFEDVIDAMFKEMAANTYTVTLKLTPAGGTADTLIFQLKRADV